MSTESRAQNAPSASNSSDLILITKGELDSLCQRALKLQRLASGYYKTIMGIKSRMKRVNLAKRRALRLTSKR